METQLKSRPMCEQLEGRRMFAGYGSGVDIEIIGGEYVSGLASSIQGSVVTDVALISTNQFIATISGDGSTRTADPYTSVQLDQYDPEAGTVAIQATGGTALHNLQVKPNLTEALVRATVPVQNLVTNDFGTMIIDATARSTGLMTTTSSVEIADGTLYFNWNQVRPAVVHHDDLYEIPNGSPIEEFTADTYQAEIGRFLQITVSATEASSRKLLQVLTKLLASKDALAAGISKAEAPALNPSVLAGTRPGLLSRPTPSASILGDEVDLLD